jgi:hypothetical protein
MDQSPRQPSPVQESAREAWLRTAPQLIAFLLLAGMLILAEHQRGTFERLLQEDGWAEWATFLAFGAAAWVGLRGYRAARRSGLERFCVLGLALFCVFVAGEEISWGQRLLGFRPPNFFLEKNYQQEANLHNLLKNILDTRFVVMAIALGYGVIAPYLARLKVLPAALAPAASLAPWFAAVAWLEFSYPYELVGELAELMLGLLLLVDLCLRTAGQEALDPNAVSPTRATSGPTRAAQLQLAALFFALFVAPLNDALLGLNAEGNAAAAREDLTTLRDRLIEGEVAKPRLLRKKRVHKRMYTAVRAGYLALDAKRHYLDPWNNPYWVAYQRGDDGQGGTLLLYSFGPNRRRDVPLSETEREGTLDGVQEAVLGGDDIGVVVKLPAGVQATR